MSSSNAMTTRKQKAQLQLSHGDEIGHTKSIKEKILTTTAGLIATGIVLVCFIAIAALSLL